MIRRPPSSTLFPDTTLFRSDTVTEKEYPLASALSYDQIYGTVNQQVIRNIRLWDWRPLRRTYRQLQELRPQYDFVRVGVDRYRMKDGLQQVMLSARELNIDDMPEIRRDWFKRTYVYTHGYGVVMSPVSETDNDGISDNGKPKMYIRDINPTNFESEWSAIGRTHVCPPLPAESRLPPPA